MPDLALYRPCVGIMLLNQNNEIFVGKRRDNQQDAWQMPQGGMETGDDAPTAMMRELFEEVGLLPHHIDILAQTPDWLTYDLPDTLKGKLWGGQYIGQKQIWFCCRFVGKDSDINLNAYHKPEFSDWKWVMADDLPALIVPFKHALYRDVLRAFGTYLGNTDSGNA